MEIEIIQKDISSEYVKGKYPNCGRVSKNLCGEIKNFDRIYGIYSYSIRKRK